MKKITVKLIVVSLLSMFLGLLIINLSSASQSLGYTFMKTDALKVIYLKDPDGKEVTLVDVEYKANKEVSKDKIKKHDEIAGFVPEDVIKKKGGKYVLIKLMTYKEYFSLGYDDMLRHDIDPDRLVWVFVSKFDKTHYVDQIPVEKAQVVTVYDAETGDFLTMNVTSEDPNGLEGFKNRKLH